MCNNSENKTSIQHGQQIAPCKQSNIHNRSNIPSFIQSCAIDAPKDRRNLLKQNLPETGDKVSNSTVATVDTVYDSFTSITSVPPEPLSDHHVHDELPRESFHSTSSTKRNHSNSKDGNRSFARQFLDLTLEVSDQRRDRRKGIKESLSWISNRISHRSITTDDLSCDGCSVQSIESMEHFDAVELEGWENADAIFIEEVHDVSKELEERLQKLGIKSPFRDVHEVIPKFKELHLQIQGDLSQQEKEHRVPLHEQAVTEDRLLAEKNQQRQIEEGELNAFLYHKKVVLSEIDGEYIPKLVFATPATLAHGLDVNFPVEAIQILEELNSPLRNRRQKTNHMDAIKENNNSFNAGW